MLNNRDGTNEKPQLKGATSSQGNNDTLGNNKSTTLKDSRSRYDKGMELYKSGKVSIGSNGLFKVSGYYEVDTERMSCNCPDYKTRKQTCKHAYAAMLFVKNRGKQSIENLEGHSNGVETKPIVTSKQPSEKPTEAHRKEFDRQATITSKHGCSSLADAQEAHRVQ